MAIIILAFHTAPVHKKIFGAIDYKYKPPFGLGLDHHWLGFFQYTTGEIFARYGSGTRRPVSASMARSGNERVPVRVFDPRARWLLDHRRPAPTVRPRSWARRGGGEAAAGRRDEGASDGRTGGRAAGGRPGGGGGRAGGGAPPGGAAM